MHRSSAFPKEKHWAYGAVTEEKLKNNTPETDNKIKIEKLMEKIVYYCCSRTPLQWLQLMVFYVLFYTVLGVFFFVCIIVNIHFLPLHYPKWQLSESSIGKNPGLGYRPMPSIEKTPIPIRIGDNSTQLWVDKLQAFLEPYYNNKSHQELMDCSRNESATLDKACLVPVPSNSPCTFANNFGYLDGSPCVLVKINRMYGWRPKPYDEPPAELLQQIQQFSRDNVYVTCIVESEEAIFNGTLEYYPTNGAIPFRYYPFYNQRGYLSPFVFVHIRGLERGVYYDVTCRAWAKNVHPDEFRRGTVIFTIYIEKLEI